MSLSIDFPYNDNPKVLLILDTSCYDKQPESPVIDVLIPGYSQTVRVPFVPGKLTILNSVSLNLSCNPDNGLTDLPDGLYYISYRVYPHKQNFVVKPLLQTAQLENEYFNQLVKLGSTDCDTQKNKRLRGYLQNIDLFLEAARASARICNKTKVNDFYQKAADLIEKIEGYTNCGCKN